MIEAKKIKCEFTSEELEDVWSALSVWDKQIDKKLNPLTVKAIQKLIKKVRKLIRAAK